MQAGWAGQGMTNLSLVGSRLGLHPGSASSRCEMMAYPFVATGAMWVRPSARSLPALIEFTDDMKFLTF